MQLPPSKEKKENNGDDKETENLHSITIKEEETTHKKHNFECQFCEKKSFVTNRGLTVHASRMHKKELTNDLIASIVALSAAPKIICINIRRNIILPKEKKKWKSEQMLYLQFHILKWSGTEETYRRHPQPRISHPKDRFDNQIPTNKKIQRTSSNKFD